MTFIVVTQIPRLKMAEQYDHDSSVRKRPVSETVATPEKTSMVSQAIGSSSR